MGDLNNIIIVYPQVKSRTINPTNPSGCWDWWGYTNSLYGKKKKQSKIFKIVNYFNFNFLIFISIATKSGPQIKVIKAIVDRLRGL